MKKLFTSFFAFAAWTAVIAQPCTPDQTFTEPGLYPASDEICCFVRNQPVSQTITFKNFNQVAGLTVSSLTVDSIVNLPQGLTYTFDANPPVYITDAFGCIQVSGTPISPAGQYKLKIYVKVSVLGLPTPLVGEADDLASGFGLSFKYLVRLKDNATADCYNLDTTQTNAQSFIPAATLASQGVDACDVSVKENGSNVSNLSIVPNPIQNQALVTFTAEQTGTYQYTITNLVGGVLQVSTINAQAGLNTFSIEKRDLSAGIYFLNISDTKATVSRKFVIAE